ncbi:MAG: MFS transporter [Anaerolineales bacterium]|nr:MFS transporter [Anaerolineales bacterium]MBS3752477.1 MFS transporter [Anaerolineales bacterium]
MKNSVKKTNLKKRDRWLWYLYDVGNSAYAAVVILAIYAAYFKEHVVGGVEGSRLWGISVGIAMLVVAIIAPVLGVIADFAGSKKRFLLFFTILSCGSTASLFFVQEGDILLGMVLFILAEIGYRGGQVFYNSLLPEIADREDFGRVSGYGWAIGLLGGIVCLLLVLGLVMSFEGTWMVRFSLVITALYFAIFATPLFLWLREKAEHKPLQKGENYLTVAVDRLKKTFNSVRDHGEFIKYIIAFLIYNDGILMMINFAAIFGVVMFGLAQQQIILFMILIQFTSVIGAFFSGWLTDFISAKKTLVIFLILMLGTAVGLFFTETVRNFYIMGGLAGLALSSVQAVSRAMVGKLSPAGRSAEFYGFFAVAGRTSSFIGPTVYGWVAAETALWFEARGTTDSFLWFEYLREGTNFAEQIGQRAAIIPVILFLVVGLALLYSVDEKGAAARLDGPTS